MAPINNEIIEDIFKEVSKSGNFNDVKKVFLSSKTGYQIFLQILKQAKAATLDPPDIIFHFDFFTWNCKNFPENLWLMSAPFIQELIIDKKDNNFYLPLFLEMTRNKVEFAQLKKVQTKYDIGEQIWKFLLDPPVNEVSVPFYSWKTIISVFTKMNEEREKDGRDKKAPFETIEIIVDKHPTCERFSNIFDFSSLWQSIHSENLIIKSYIPNFWNDFYRSFNTNINWFNSLKLTHLKIIFYDSIRVSAMTNIYLSNLLCNFEKVFCNLNEVDMNVITEFENFFGIDTQPDFIETIVDVLTNQVKAAKIKFHKRTI